MPAWGHRGEAREAVCDEAGPSWDKAPAPESPQCCRHPAHVWRLGGPDRQGEGQGEGAGGVAVMTWKEAMPFV